MATLVDSYSESNQNSFYAMISIVRLGQSFTGDGKTLDSCKFYLKKIGSPTGNAVAKIYAHTGTFGSGGLPTGSPLATSDNFDVSTLTESFALTEFNFTGANRINLENGTHYCVVVEYSDGDEFNYVHLGIDTTSPTHNGNLVRHISYWEAKTYDCCFYVYGVYEITCSAGSFTLTGQDVALRLDRKIALAVGNFTLTGIDVGFSVGKRMLLECGNFVLTGRDIGLKMTRKLVCGAGSFILTGIDVGLKKGYTIICGVGKFILTGMDVLFKRSMRNRSKNSTSFSNHSKNSTTFTNKSKNSTNFTNRRR